MFQFVQYVENTMCQLSYVTDDYQRQRLSGLSSDPLCRAAKKVRIFNAGWIWIRTAHICIQQPYIQYIQSIDLFSWRQASPPNNDNLCVREHGWAHCGHVQEFAISEAPQPYKFRLFYVCITAYCWAYPKVSGSGPNWINSYDTRIDTGEGLVVCVLDRNCGIYSKYQGIFVLHNGLLLLNQVPEAVTRLVEPSELEVHSVTYNHSQVSAFDRTAQIYF